MLITLLACIKRELYKLVINVLLRCVHSVKQPQPNGGPVMVRTTQRQSILEGLGQFKLMC